ncbi:MAG: hypothetical protein H0X37_10155 [Herpetosiphonaceae bacterium]|nr:hypothetical protein [Herpetosiphonaceae bacterium]
MTATELLPTLRDLTRADKLRVMQFLVGELAKEEEIDLTATSNYPVWSPHTAFEAADTLLVALAADKYDPA